MHKRYLVFSEVRYELNGGWGDCRGAFETLDEAKQCDLKAGPWGNQDPDRAYIIDLETEEIVHEFETIKRY